MLLKQSTAANRPIYLGLPSLSPTITISKDGGSFGSLAGSVTDLGSGWYNLALTSGDTDTLGSLAYSSNAGTVSGDMLDTVATGSANDICGALPLGHAAGAANGLFVLGANTTPSGGVSITCSSGDAFSINASGSFATGLVINSTGGIGMQILSSASSTPALRVQSSSGVAAVFEALTSGVVAVQCVSSGGAAGLSGSLSGPLLGTIGGFTAAALAQFFTLDTTKVYADAISGSVVHEIASNAGGGDPWATAVPGAYGAGTAGFALGTNLDVLVSSRSTYAGGPVASVSGDVDGNVAGNVVGSVGSVAGAVGSVAGVTFPANFGTLAISSAGRVQIQSAIPINTGITSFPFVMFSSTDHSTPIAGLTVTAQRSIDGGAFGACAHSPVNVANGAYSLQLAASDVNGSWIVLLLTAVGADPSFITLGTTP